MKYFVVLVLCLNAVLADVYTEFDNDKIYDGLGGATEGFSASGLADGGFSSNSGSNTEYSSSAGSANFNGGSYGSRAHHSDSLGTSIAAIPDLGGSGSNTYLGSSVVGSRGHTEIDNIPIYHGLGGATEGFSASGLADGGFSSNPGSNTEYSSSAGSANFNGGSYGSRAHHSDSLGTSIAAIPDLGGSGSNTYLGSSVVGSRGHTEIDNIPTYHGLGGATEGFSASGLADGGFSSNSGSNTEYSSSAGSANFNGGSYGSRAHHSDSLGTSIAAIADLGGSGSNTYLGSSVVGSGGHTEIDNVPTYHGLGGANEGFSASGLADGGFSSNSGSNTLAGSANFNGGSYGSRAHYEHRIQNHDVPQYVFDSHSSVRKGSFKKKNVQRVLVTSLDASKEARSQGYQFGAVGTNGVINGHNSNSGYTVPSTTLGLAGFDASKFGLGHQSGFSIDGAHSSSSSYGSEFGTKSTLGSSLGTKSKFGSQFGAESSSGESSASFDLQTYMKVAEQLAKRQAQRVIAGSQFKNGKYWAGVGGVDTKLAGVSPNGKVVVPHRLERPPLFCGTY